MKKLKEKLEKLLKEARGVADGAMEEDRDFTADERQKVANLLEEAAGVKEKIKEKEGDEKLRQRIMEMGEGINVGSNSQKNGSNGNAKIGARFLAEPRYNTLGEAFVRSQMWQKWLEANAPGGRIPDARKGISSPPLEFKRFGLFRKDLLTGEGSDSAGAFVESERTGIYEPLGRHPLTIRDLISTRVTNSDTVEFVRQLTQVQQAAPVPEANVTDFAGATGEISGEKPEASMTFERVSEQVKTIAVWIPATKRALSDAAQLRGLIDQELREDLQEELEDQILNGDGTGENFTGIANTANVLAQAFDTDLITTTRKAITNLLINGKQRPTAFLVHPSDWETIELLKDDQGRYYWGGPMARGAPTLWGVPVAQSFFVAQGTAYLANWSKVVLWDREQANISVSDSHNDFFIRNMVAILAELRAALGVIRPSAIVEVDLLSGS